jgi:hypothetical protein
VRTIESALEDSRQVTFGRKVSRLLARSLACTRVSDPRAFDAERKMPPSERALASGEKSSRLAAWIVQQEDAIFLAKYRDFRRSPHEQRRGARHTETTT